MLYTDALHKYLVRVKKRQLPSRESIAVVPLPLKFFILPKDSCANVQHIGTTPNNRYG